MTTTAMCTTTEMMSALLERVVDDLYARGIRALYSHFELCDFLFSRDASTTARVVAMAVRFYAEFGAVKAFTRGALCLSDNFDTVAGQSASKRRAAVLAEAASISCTSTWHSIAAVLGRWDSSHEVAITLRTLRLSGGSCLWM
jgi:hypothetical protein